MHLSPLSIPSYAFSHFEFHFGKEAGTDMGAEHSIDGVRAAMEMHTVFYKTSNELAKETLAAAAATATAGSSGYYWAVVAATADPIDPAGIAVIAYQIDGSFSFFFSSQCSD